MSTPRPHRPARVGLVLAAAVAASAVACRSTSQRLGLPPPPTVAALDLPAYMGEWFEIARFDERFQRGCVGSRAMYTLRDDGGVRVSNRCRRGDPDGPWREVRGRARRKDPGQPGKLEVNFFGPFWADYWVIELGPQMRHAVVGHPSRDHLWILSRTPQMDPATYDGIVARLGAMGFATERLLYTAQKP